MREYPERTAFPSISRTLHSVTVLPVQVGQPDRQAERQQVNSAAALQTVRAASSRIQPRR